MVRWCAFLFWCSVAVVGERGKVYPCRDHASPYPSPPSPSLPPPAFPLLLTLPSPFPSPHRAFNLKTSGWRSGGASGEEPVEVEVGTGQTDGWEIWALPIPSCLFLFLPPLLLTLTSHCLTFSPSLSPSPLPSPFPLEFYCTQVGETQDFGLPNTL